MGLDIIPPILPAMYMEKRHPFLSMLKHPKAGHPYLTQKGRDRESGEDQYVAHMCDGSVAGYKYFDLSETKEIRINICGNASGTVYIRTREMRSRQQRSR